MSCQKISSKHSEGVLGSAPFEKNLRFKQLSTTQIACLKSRRVGAFGFFWGLQRWSSKLMIEECIPPFFLFGPVSFFCVSEQFMWGFVTEIQHFDWIFWEAPNFWDTSWLDLFLPPVMVAASKDQLHALSGWLSQGTAWGWVCSMILFKKKKTHGLWKPLIPFKEIG